MMMIMVITSNAVEITLWVSLFESHEILDATEKQLNPTHAIGNSEFPD